MKSRYRMKPRGSFDAGTWRSGSSWDVHWQVQERKSLLGIRFWWTVYEATSPADDNNYREALQMMERFRKAEHDAALAEARERAGQGVMGEEERLWEDCRMYLIPNTAGDGWWVYKWNGTPEPEFIGGRFATRQMAIETARERAEARS